MFENIDIEKVKEELRNHSTNYKENFAKIEKFMSITAQEHFERFIHLVKVLHKSWMRNMIL